MCLRNNVAETEYTKYDVNTKKKTVILVLVRYYLPGHKSGGPVRSIANMVELLGDEFDFLIITSDRDSMDMNPYDGVVLDNWNQVGKARVYYLSKKNHSFTEIVKVLAKTNFDVMYLNSFFDPVFTQRPLWARLFGLIPFKPVVIAPRGEFSAAALRLKLWKKMPYRWFTTVVGLYRNLTWHASSKYEAESIKRVIGGVAPEIRIASVVTSDSTSLLNDNKLPRSTSERKISSPLRIVFLSRIAPMKNLDFALRALAEVKVPVDFSIYGPMEDVNYWMKCEGLIAILPLNISTHYRGAVDHSKVKSVLESHDLFFLPTRGENFGHVIMESLSAGTPVLIADTTPWRNLEADGVGWDLPLTNVQKFVDTIHEISEISEEAYRKLRCDVLKYAHKHATAPEIIASNRSLFVNAVCKQDGFGSF